LPIGTINSDILKELVLRNIGKFFDNIDHVGRGWKTFRTLHFELSQTSSSFGHPEPANFENLTIDDIPRGCAELSKG